MQGNRMDIEGFDNRETCKYLFAAKHPPSESIHEQVDRLPEVKIVRE